MCTKSAQVSRIHSGEIGHEHDKLCVMPLPQGIKLHTMTNVPPVLLPDCRHGLLELRPGSAVVVLEMTYC